MGYIKKLKNNELVGGTDKHTVYPVTSTEAVFEEVIEDGESNFKSQKFLNNNITGDRINEGTITDYNIAAGTITKGKLTPQVQTMLDEGQKKALTPKGNYNLETEYEALDLVFDPVTNSSYISLVTPNVGHPVDENAEGYEEGWWEKTLDGTAVNTAQATINAKVGQLETQVGTAITQAETAVDEAKQETLNAYTQAEALAQQITDWSSSEISSTPSYTDQHPLSNRASSAQVGYFECGTSSATQASNQIKAVTAGGYALPTSGGAVKIKMYAANTYTPTTNNPVKLQFNADATTLKELKYNGEAVSPNNTWDADEVISVYYDGTYYQASNAMGGGSAVGKKKLTGATGYITTNEDSIGAYNSLSTWRYIKYPVNPGDVVMISGQGGSSPRLYAIARENDTIIQKEETENAVRKDLVLVMPEEAKWIVLNNNYSTEPNYEWYFAKKGSIGAHEMLTESYLYGDLRTLSLGQTYKEGEAVKTTDKQLLRIAKEVGILNNTDEVATGDLKANATATYKALKDVATYNGTETEGLYAIGRPSIITITIDASSLSITEDTNISVTIGDDTQSITVTATASETKAADIAALIAAAFTSIEGWSLTDNENGTLTLKCNTGGANTIIVNFNVGTTGLAITSNAINGNSTLSQYNNGAWSNVNVNNYAEDTEMWQALDINDLSKYSLQNSLASYLKVKKTVTSKPYTQGKNLIVLYRGGFYVKKDTVYTIKVKSKIPLNQSFITIGIANIGEKRFENNIDFSQGVVAQLTSTMDKEEASVYLYGDNGTLAGVELDCEISWEEFATSIEEKVRWEEKEKKKKESENTDTYSYRKVSIKIPYSYTGGYLYAKFNAQFANIVSSTTAYHITDYIECSGASKLKYPQQRASDKYIGLVFYDSDHRPIYGHWEHCIYKNGVDVAVNLIVDVPDNAAYFRNSVWDGNEEYTLYYEPSTVQYLTYFEIVDNLSDGGTNKVLSAEQGKVLGGYASSVDYITGNPTATFNNITTIGRTNANILDVSLDSTNDTIKFEGKGNKTSYNYAWINLPSNLINGQIYKISITSRTQ